MFDELKANNKNENIVKKKTCPQLLLVRIEYYTKEVRHIGKEVSEACKDVKEIEISLQFSLLHK